jgi:hypothetical protein
LCHLVLESHDGRALGADSEEKHEPASDIDTAVADSLKALDLKRPIREADIPDYGCDVRKVPKAEALDWTIILPFSQLGGLHGAQWSRSSDLKRIIEDQVTTAEFAKRRCDAHGR